jgi:two-component system response regulator RpfG
MALLFTGNKLTMKASVLILDDQLVSRMILEELVRSIGDEITTQAFYDPLKALEWLKRNKVDLILADYSMPNLDGVELTQWLRKTPNCTDIPIVIVTCFNEKEVRYRALEAGATDFITKPIDHYECRSRCKNLILLRQHQISSNKTTHALEQKIRGKAQHIVLSEREGLLRLARTSEYCHNHSGGHRERIAFLVKTIAQSAGEDEKFCEYIEHAAPLYDIGKIGLPHSIVKREHGELNKYEAQMLMRHTIIGHDILFDSPSPYIQFAARVALSHHEHYDGSGYPQGLRKDKISPSAAIVAIADAFDDLVAPECKDALEPEAALEHLKQFRGTRFNPDYIDAFTHAFDKVLAAEDVFEPKQKFGLPPERFV